MLKQRVLMPILCILVFTLFLIGCNDKAAPEKENVATQADQAISAEGADQDQHLQDLVRYGPEDRLPGSLKFASVSLQASGVDFFNDNEQKNQEDMSNQEANTVVDTSDQKPQQTEQVVETEQTQPPAPTEEQKEEKEPEEEQPGSEPEEEIQPPKPGTMEYILWQQGKHPDQKKQNPQTTTETTKTVIQDQEGGIYYQEESTVITTN